MRALLLALLALALGLPAAAKLPAGEFLSVPVDVRSLGMAEASQAVAVGVPGASVNPSAIVGVRAQQFYFTHSFLFAGIGSDYLGYGLALGAHRFGVSYRHVGYGSLEGRDVNGVATGGFGPSDTAYGFTYGTTSGNLALGGTVKLVESKIVDTARATTFDVGAAYRVNDEWVVGASGQNLSGSLKFEQEAFPLPRRFAVGGGWRAAEGWWVSLDAVQPTDTPSYFAAGTEYQLPINDVGRLAFRVGVNTRAPDLGPAGSMKAGLGFRFRDLDVDYAFGAGGDLGDTHQFGIGYRFGKVKDEE